MFSAQGYRFSLALLVMLLIQHDCHRKNLPTSYLPVGPVALISQVTGSSCRRARQVEFTAGHYYRSAAQRRVSRLLACTTDEDLNEDCSAQKQPHGLVDKGALDSSLHSDTKMTLSHRTAATDGSFNVDLCQLAEM
jgi:hypothetical protein